MEEMASQRLERIAQATNDAVNQVKAAFAPFEEDDFIFSAMTHFEHWFFQNLWLLPIPVIPVAIWSLNILLRQVNTYGEIYGIDKVIQLSSGLLVFPVVLVLLAFEIPFVRGLIKSVPKVLLALAHSGRLRPPFEDEDGQDKGVPPVARKSPLYVEPPNWKTYANDMASAWRNPRRHALSGIFVTVFVVGDIILTLTVIPLSTLLADVPLVLRTVLELIAMGWLFYWSGINLWMLYVLARYIRFLNKVFRLDIQPRHGDGCGGLKPIGDLCLKLAVMLAPPAIICSYFLFSSLVTPGGTFIWILGWAILWLLVIIAAILAFVTPMWDIHRTMVRSKDGYQNEAIQYVSLAENRLRELLNQGKIQDAETKALQDQLTDLRELFPPDLDYPTWPVNVQTLLSFVGSQVAAGLVGKLVSLVVERP
jgi:uncharacterized membrane protein